LVWTSGGGNYGTIKKFPVTILEFLFVQGIKTGLTIDDGRGFRYESATQIPDSPMTTPHLSFINPGIESVSLRRVRLVTLDASESGLFFSPVIDSLANAVVENVGPGPLGTFFKAGDTGSIGLIVDTSIPATAINSVTSGTAIPGGGNYARFQHLGTGVFVGQRVVNSTFTPEVTYNQTLIVTFAAATSFEGNIESSGAPIPFTADDAGSYLSEIATVTSTVAHGQGNGQALLQTNTINYNGGFEIFNVAGSTYLINVAPAASETSGNWDAGSLTEKDKRINVEKSGSQKDSMIAGGWDLTGNVSATTVVSGVFNDIDFTGAIRLSYNERIDLIESVNGTCRYDGLAPSVESIPIEFYIIPNNSSDREYDLKLLIDTGSGFVDLPDLIITRVNVKGTNTLFSSRRTVELTPGDKYKWVLSGVGTTNGFIAERGCSTI